MIDIMSLYDLNTNNDSETLNYIPCRLSQMVLSADSVYLCCNSIDLLMWVGRDVNKNWLKAVFNTDSVQGIHPYAMTYVQDINYESKLLLRIVKHMQNLGHINKTVFICAQAGAYESLFIKLLTDDKTAQNSLSMIDIWNKFFFSNVNHQYQPPSSAMIPPIHM